MVFPLYDDNTDRLTTPFVNYAFLALNIFVFVVLQRLGSDTGFTYAFSTVPQEIMTGTDVVTSPRVVEYAGQQVQIPGLGETPLSVYLTLFTSMFMHGGIAHIAGNMLFLWIFGDNIEDRLGRAKFLTFYIICGLAASAAHIVFSADSVIPSLGASGAIAGVLGSYLILYPKKKVRVLVARSIVHMPAWAVLGLWIALQVYSQIGVSGGQSSGVAYLAHIGGFVAGVVLTFLFGAHRKPVARFQ